MSKNNRKSEHDRVRQNRPARESHVPTRPQRSEEDRVLGQLPYRKGHLTPQEIACFEQLHGKLSSDELDELNAVSETLRRVRKRIRALHLLRYWGAPLNQEQRWVLPLLAGLPWLRELPTRPDMTSSALARHLLCDRDIPRFLLEPFRFPESYRTERMRWDMARIVSVVGRGEGLLRLREYDSFWSWVPEPVFATFLQSDDTRAVPEALVAAFVRDWQGPSWVADVAYRAAYSSAYRLRTGLPAMLRVAHSLCIDPVDPAQADATASRRLAALPPYTELFGHVAPTGLLGMPPGGPPGWMAHELRTPEDFEQAEASTSRALRLYFQDALRGTLSIWRLVGPERTVLIEVDLTRRHAHPFDRNRFEGDAEVESAIAAWAQANVLQHESTG